MSLYRTASKELMIINLVTFEAILVIPGHLNLLLQHARLPVIVASFGNVVVALFEIPAYIESR